jgi:probable HAF family extracellular repeat protein
MPDGEAVRIPRGIGGTRSILGSCAVVALAAPASGASSITIVDIGGVGGQRLPSAALAVSNGNVVGYGITGNGAANAVSTRGAQLTDIGAGLEGTLADAVNASGVAAGQVFLPGQSQQRAIEFSGGREIDLGVLPGDASSVATGINASGVVVGTSTPATSRVYVSQAFVYARGVAPLRKLPGFIGATANGINDSGAIVGSVGQKAFLAGETSSYVFDGTTVTLFATNHGLGNSVATAINASGVVVGYHSAYAFSVNAPLHAYSYAGGTLTDLGTLYPSNAGSSVALAINTRGVAVGYSQAPRGVTPPHATAFFQGEATDLNALLPAKSGWLLEEAEGIDDLGNVVGIGLHGTLQRGFILRTGALFASH